MANLTNSGKLITKIEAIDSSIQSLEEKVGSIPAGTDIGQEITEINTTIGELPEGKTVAQAIEDAASAASDAAGAAANVASDLSDFESEVAETYATKDSVASAFLYKGTKATYAELPASGNKVGDVWNITTADASHDVKAGDNVVWNGEAWDVLAGIVDLSNYYTKAQVDAAINAGGEATSALADRVTDLETDNTTNKADISGLKTSMQTAEGDIDNLEGRMDSAETDIGNRYTKTEINAITGLSSASAGFVSNTVAEGTDGKVTVTAADNVSVATAESNNKAAISALGTAHNNVIDRLEAVEAATEATAEALPFEVKYIDVTFNAGKIAEVSDSFITAATAVDTWVVTSGTAESYAYEYEVEAGKITFKASNNESITMRVRLSKEISA